MFGCPYYQVWGQLAFGYFTGYASDLQPFATGNGRFLVEKYDRRSVSK
jgi:hypothetical protein